MRSSVRSIHQYTQYTYYVAKPVATINGYHIAREIQPQYTYYVAKPLANINRCQIDREFQPLTGF